MELSAIILAGGKSTRMGQDKGLVNYKGKPMIEYALDVCRRYTNRIIIATNNQQYAAFGYPLVSDNFKGAGPMGGIEAGLTCSATDNNMVCPCDMPNIQPEMLDAVLQKSSGKLAVIVEDNTGKVFPVLGYYSKSALPVIRQQLNTGDFKLMSLVYKLHAETVVISSEFWLSNVNCREDLI